MEDGEFIELAKKVKGYLDSRPTLSKSALSTSTSRSVGLVSGQITLEDLARIADVDRTKGVALMEELVRAGILIAHEDFPGLITLTEGLRMKEYLVKEQKKRFDFDPESGTGVIRGKSFKLLYGKPEYKVFAECFANVGKRVSKERILELIDYPPESHTAINEITRILSNIRKKTSLDTNELQQNNGGAILVLMEN